MLIDIVVIFFISSVLITLIFLTLSIFFIWKIMKKNYVEIQKNKLKIYIERLYFLQRGAGKITQQIIAKQIRKFEQKLNEKPPIQ